MMGRLALAPLLLMAALCGCSSTSTQVKMSADDAESGSGSWDAVLSAHTLRGQIWQEGILHAADLDATLVTPSLRSSFISNRAQFAGAASQRIAEDLVMLGKAPDEGVDAPLAKGPSGEDNVVVYAALWADDSEFRDLGTSFGAWTIELVRGDLRREPKEIDILRNDKPLAQILPHLDRFDKVYALYFDNIAEDGQAFVGPGAEPLRLVARSALGEMTLEWNLSF